MMKYDTKYRSLLHPASFVNKVFNASSPRSDILKGVVVEYESLYLNGRIGTSTSFLLEYLFRSAF